MNSTNNDVTSSRIPDDVVYHEMQQIVILLREEAEEHLLAEVRDGLKARLKTLYDKLDTI